MSLNYKRKKKFEKKKYVSLNIFYISFSLCKTIQKKMKYISIHNDKDSKLCS